MLGDEQTFGPQQSAATLKMPRILVLKIT